MKQKLFLDAAQDIITNNKYVLDIKNSRNKDLKISRFKVDNDNQKNIKRETGDYYTIEYNDQILFKHESIITKEIVRVLKKLIKSYNKSGTTLIIGLGNTSILADALGPKTTNKIIATNHYDDFLTIPKVALFVPEVISKTGISSFNLIKMLVHDLKPDMIIIIDSLSTNKTSRFNTTVEISDAGIIPGSTIKNNKEINKNTFNIPVISMGIPLLLEIDNEFYTKPNIHQIIEKSSDILADAINTTLFH